MHLIKWRFRVNDHIYVFPAMFSSPAVANGKVYFGSGSRYVYALNTETGQLIWKVLTDARVSSSPAVAGDRVYLGTDRGVVLALDAADGTEPWRFSAEGGVLSSPAVYDNRLFFGSMDRQLYVLK